MTCERCEELRRELAEARAEVERIHSRLLARSMSAYCDMISVAKRDESLGWEIKVKRGEFGIKELDSHTKIGELLGRHRALVEACREIDKVLNGTNAAAKGATA